MGRGKGVGSSDMAFYRSDENFDYPHMDVQCTRRLQGAEVRKVARITLNRL